MFGLFGNFTAHPGERDRLAGYLLRAAKMLSDDPGCLHYVVSTSGDPDAVFISEVWTDEAAHAAALEPAEIRALITEARPLIAGMGEQTRLKVLGGKGLPG